MGAHSLATLPDLMVRGAVALCARCVWCQHVHALAGIIAAVVYTIAHFIYGVRDSNSANLPTRSLVGDCHR